MIDNRKVLAMIPARGGSKGIKNKNILDIQGKPLIAYTIEAAKDSSFVDRIFVSTDSEKIKEISEQYGAAVPFLRPAELAQDKTPTLDVVLHDIKKLEAIGEIYDILILLQPTSPLRTADNIDEALEIFLANECRPLAAVSKVSDHPILIRTISGGGSLEKLLPESSTVRRQDMPAYYRVNGSIYIYLIDEINNGTSFNDSPVPYIMGQEQSVDIDDESDVAMAQYYLTSRA